MASMHSQMGQKPTLVGQVHKEAQAVAWELSAEQASTASPGIRAPQQAPRGMFSHIPPICVRLYEKLNMLDLLD